MSRVSYCLGWLLSGGGHSDSLVSGDLRSQELRHGARLERPGVTNRQARIPFPRALDRRRNVYFRVLAAARHHRRDDDDAIGAPGGLVERLVQAGRAELVE